MTTVPLSLARTKRGRLALASAAALLLAGTAGYFYYRSRPPAVPAFDTAGLDAEVARAIEQARADVVAEPRSAAAWGRFGTVLFAHDLYAESTGVFAQAERFDPAEAKWPYFRGLALLPTAPDDGLAALARAAQLAPRSLPFRLRLAEQSLEYDRLDDADRLFGELAADHPDEPRVLLGRGQVLVRRGRWQEAVVPLTAAAAHPTARRSARAVLAEAYAGLGNAAAVEEQRRLAAGLPADAKWDDPYLRAAVELQTGLRPRIERARQLLRDGAVREAGALALAVLRDHPDSDEAHLTLARVLIRTGDLDGAAAALREAARLNPESLDAHFLLAGVLKQRKDYDAAERGYRRAVELKPNLGAAHYQLGDCRLKRGDRAGAAEAFRAAAAYSPDLADAHVALGELLLQDGRHDEAVKAFDRALRLDESNDRARKLREQAAVKRKS